MGPAMPLHLMVGISCEAFALCSESETACSEATRREGGRRARSGEGRGRESSIIGTWGRVGFKPLPVYLSLSLSVIHSVSQSVSYSQSVILPPSRLIARPISPLARLISPQLSSLPSMILDCRYPLTAAATNTRKA